MRFRSVSSELHELRSVPQERKPKGKEQEEAKQREDYLEFEVRLPVEVDCVLELGMSRTVYMSKAPVLMS